MKEWPVIGAGLRHSSKLVNHALVRSFSWLLVNEKVPVQEQRRRFDTLNLIARAPKGVSLEQTQVAGVPVEVITPDHYSGGKHLVYFHGGAFCVGAPKTHRDLTVSLAKILNRKVWVVDYRLAPENPFPAAPEDCLAVYRELLADIAPQDIALAGDSAGGNLVLVVMLMARDQKLPLPAAGVLYSPWTDLRCCTESYYTKRTLDPMLTGPWLRRMRDHYRNGADVHLPELSPVFADLSGLPPMLLHVGSNEVLLNDSLNLEARVRACGGQIHFKVWDSLWHVFHAHVQYLEVARQAVTETRTFLRQVNDS